MLLACLRHMIKRAGFEVSRYRDTSEIMIPTDLDARDAETIRSVQPFTMTSVERIHALCVAARYVSAANILGSIVECGVWRGGSMMAVAKTLLVERSEERALYLFDTFEGMTSPTDRDMSISGDRAFDLMAKSERSEQDLLWCYSPEDVVKRAMASTGYPESKLHFVKGKVEDTIPAEAPECIAILRLDTDWYESTKHELVHLFPRLSLGGVLIIDDYGHWQGARAAVDEYIAENRLKLLLNRIDYTGRIAIKAFA